MSPCSLDLLVAFAGTARLSVRCSRCVFEAPPTRSVDSLRLGLLLSLPKNLDDMVGARWYSTHIV